jgi:anti-sigma factor RsiW
MKCTHSPEELASYAGGDLSREDRVRLDRHLDDCADCRAELTLLRDTVSEVRSLRDDIVARECLLGLRDRVRTEIAARPWPGWAVALERLALAGFRSPWTVAGAVGLVAVGAFSLWLALPPDVEVEPAPVAALVEAPPIPEVTVPDPLPEPERAAALEPEDSVPAEPSTAASPDAGADRQVLVKLLTDNPNVVIYWVVEDDSGGDEIEGGV